ncbi:MAG: hypothetical protein Q9174_003215 [Haloplaca sp. 1 TL-2023]
MEYSQHTFAQHGLPMMGPYPPPHFQDESAAFRPESYALGSDGPDHNTVPTHPIHNSVIPSLEEAAEMDDTSTRPRLTPEQIAVLEDNFKTKPKPGTDFKKQLATSIGLSLQRVNNWYQNRRAKARHQRPQERRFDVFPNDASGFWSSGDLVFPNFNNDVLDQSPLHSSTSEHALAFDYMSIPRSEDVVDSTSNLHGELDMFQGYLNSVNTTNDVPSDNEVPASHQFPETNSMAPTKLITPQVQSWGLQDWTPDSQNGTQFIDDGLATFQASHNTFSQAMYQSSVEGYHVGNLSCQTLATASSSDGEQPSLMTPPQRTSPLPFLPHDSHDRRESVSADLASDFNTIHLQRSRSSFGFPGESNGAAAFSQSHTPDVSPPAPPQLHIDVTMPHVQPTASPAVHSFSAPRLDLASRRKQPRPAALRPESQRSVSYGPMTLSPTARMPSLGISKQASVRRIKSTGNGLNAGNGRIQKPGVAAAPLSPRNFHSLSSNDFVNHNAHPTKSSSQNITPLTPLSPFPVDHQEPAWLTQWAQEADNATPTAEAHITSPPITPYDAGFQPSFIHAAPQTCFQWPPQSAPPQQTTFFDSPPMPPTNFNHFSWQAPPSISLQGFHEEPIGQVMRPPMIPHGGYLDLQPLPSQHQHVYQQMGFFQPPFLESSPPQKEIEIQVQVIPAPEGLPQSRKTYTFNHTTPKDFSNAEGTKVSGTTDPNPI